MREHDPIYYPAHYTKGKLEVIQAIEGLGLGYAEGNVLKYLTRYKLKGTPLEDLKKARWYVDRLIQEYEARKLVPLSGKLAPAPKVKAKAKKNHKAPKPPAGTKLCLAPGCTKRPKKRGPYTGFCTQHGQTLKAEDRKKLREEAAKKANSKPAEAPAQ